MKTTKTIRTVPYTVRLPDLRRVNDDEEARRILESCGLRYHHSAADTVYISKRVGYGICEIYNGHFGKGIIVHRAESRSYSTHSYREYWLEEGD